MSVLRKTCQMCNQVPTLSRNQRMALVGNLPLHIQSKLEKSVCEKCLEWSLLDVARMGIPGLKKFNEQFSEDKTK